MANVLIFCEKTEYYQLNIIKKEKKLLFLFSFVEK